jgi:Ser/Thr protein kinase RdoA (MazF antagonist)
MVLFHAAPGRPLAQQPIDVQCPIVGRVAAQLHDVAGDFTSPHPRAPLLDLDRFLDLSSLETFASGREDDLSCFQQVADRVKGVLSSLPLTALPQGV